MPQEPLGPLAASFASLVDPRINRTKRHQLLDIVLIAIVGTAGLLPALAAIRAGKDIAIASKEILVMAGEAVMTEARKYGVRVLAVDSDKMRIKCGQEQRVSQNGQTAADTAAAGSRVSRSVAINPEHPAR